MDPPTPSSGRGGGGSNTPAPATSPGGGALTMTAGNATNAGAAMGAGRDQVNATVNVNVQANNITLNDSPLNGSRFGHSSANNGPGDIFVTANGNLTMNAANGQGTVMRTQRNIFV